MDAFLVVARFPADDFPVGLFTTLRGAVAFAETDPTPSAEMLDQFSAIIHDAAVSYVIVGFEDGRPVPETTLQLAGKAAV